MGQVVKLKTTEVRKPSKKAIKASKRQAMGAVAVGTVALTLTGLSLTHLSHGIELVTHAPQWESWAMAVGVDLGFVSLELAKLAVVKDSVMKKVDRFINPTIMGTLVGSALMNAFAFGSQATGYMLAPAIAFGLAIPAMIYAMTRVGATMWIEK